MNPNHLPAWESLTEIFTKLAGADIDLELFVLKCHLLAESLMYSFLAQRLQVEERQLPQLQFFPLAKLAFCGAKHGDTLRRVLALNDVRNAFGHHLDSAMLQAEFGKFAARSDVPWPDEIDASLSAQLNRVRRGAVRTSCFVTIINAWIDLALYYFAQIGASPEQLALVSSRLQEARSEVNDLRKLQRELHETFELLRSKNSKGPPIDGD